MDLDRLLQKRERFRQALPRIPALTLESYERAFEVEYTHNSNAIEGNTLTLMETKLILEDAISPGGKSLREIYEATNHQKAYRYVKACIAQKLPLSEKIVKDIHAILMENILVGGVYRSVDVYISGAQHTPPSPNEMYRQVKEFYADLGWKGEALDPIAYAAWTHAEFVRIHPFPDGNGRMGRLWNSKILTDSDPSYGMISLETQILRRREEYYDVLERCQHSEPQDCTEFVGFVLDCLTDAFASLSHIGDGNISALLDAMEDRPMTSNEIMERMGLSHKTNFMRRYLNPAIELGLVFRTEGGRKSRNQMYRRMV